jgi:hypothetical protein
MIAKLFCPYCIYEAAKVGQPSPYVPIPIVHVNDDGRYEINCPVGHKSIVVLQNLKFELLFEFGVHAIGENNFRDAVISFASSLETFYEFFFRVIAANQTIDDNTTECTWKHLAAQSERQLGAFLAAYTLFLKPSAPPLPPNSAVQLRNRVVHRGYVPTKDEALSFGQSILDILDSSIDRLRAASSEILTRTYDKLLPPEATDVEKGDPNILVGAINILVSVDVRHPREADGRAGDLKHQVERVLTERSVETRMRAISADEAKKMFPDVKLPEVNKPLH